MLARGGGNSTDLNIDRAKIDEAAKAAMESLDFHVTRLTAPVAAFSGGQRQAVAIGRATTRMRDS